MNTEFLPLTPTTDQRAKMAYVYIRQSSLMQVTRPASSTELQYRWWSVLSHEDGEVQRVEVIDEDLGKSGCTGYLGHPFKNRPFETGKDLLPSLQTQEGGCTIRNRR
jgi:hypothetical protein